MGGECVMPFLPVEFGGAQKHTRAHFPTHHVHPLIQFQRQITIRLDPTGHCFADNGFGCGPNDVWFGQFRIRVGLQRAVNHTQTVMGDDGGFFRKSSDVFSFFVKKFNGNQQREICVLNALGLDPFIHFITHQFPNGPTIRFDGHATAHGGIFRQIGRGD